MALPAARLRICSRQNSKKSLAQNPELGEQSLGGLGFKGDSGFHLRPRSTARLFGVWRAGNDVLATMDYRAFGDQEDPTSGNRMNH